MRVKVRYTVELEAEIEVAEDDSLSDAVCDIDIPEGGADNSKYIPDTFEVASVQNELGETLNWAVYHS